MGLEVYYKSSPWWKPRSKRMEITILEYGPTNLKFKVDGETHTLFNALRMELLADEDVSFAAYKIEHPLFDRIVFTLRTKKGDPLEALERAVLRLKEKFGLLKEKFKEAFEKGESNPPFVSSNEWRKFIKKNIP